MVIRRGPVFAMPGFASAHSHAFQRGLRGLTQRRGQGGDSFWSWRELMYRLAGNLDPDSIYALSHFAFIELALAGVTAVGEFHYVHHQADGTAYDNRTELAESVVRAARDAGIRIALLRVLYRRGGPGRDAQGAQRRFCDARLEDALTDVETLRARFRDDPGVAVGLAPHSIRAVPLSWITGAADYARAHDLPLHMHVAEQQLEIEQCKAEHGAPPVTVLANEGVLDSRFVAVHATHLEDAEVEALGAAGSGVCICRTTERDLGDGLPRATDLVHAGAWLCTGVDSHSISDPFEEARAIELDERSRRQIRHAAADATELLEAATGAGYRALGLDHRGDELLLDATDPALVGLAAADADEAVIFAGSPRAVREVRVAGSAIIEDGRHPGYDSARDAYVTALERLLG